MCQADKQKFSLEVASSLHHRIQKIWSFPSCLGHFARCLHTSRCTFSLSHWPAGVSCLFLKLNGHLRGSCPSHVLPHKKGMSQRGVTQIKDELNNWQRRSMTRMPSFLLLFFLFYPSCRVKDQRSYFHANPEHPPCAKPGGHGADTFLSLFLLKG